jgi:hypothetical protein
VGEDADWLNGWFALQRMLRRFVGLVADLCTL